MPLKTRASSHSRVPLLSNTPCDLHCRYRNCRHHGGTSGQALPKNPITTRPGRSTLNVLRANPHANCTPDDSLQTRYPQSKLQLPRRFHGSGVLENVLHCLVGMNLQMLRYASREKTSLLYLREQCFCNPSFSQRTGE